MGHAQITTTQKYLHSLPDADAKNLTALDHPKRFPRIATRAAWLKPTRHHRGSGGRLIAR